MAAEGGGTGTGGKIRNRRYHLSSGRTPYSKNRPQGQQGIISRVTNTVKSIVPSWLQRYFNNDEVPARSLNTNDVEEHAETTEHVTRHIYVEEDRIPSADDRITADPVRMQEPSTSRFSLNAPDVLTRPSLHRPNLNFNILDSPTLHCQPSTSSTFPINTSSFSLVKEIKDTTSQHDDDNISTTSGFSSRASEKDVAVVRGSNAPPLWSPEVDRTHNLHNSTMNSKKPTFNLSAFGSLSPSLGSTSVLKSSVLGDSPFYPGKTTYGGAAAVRASRVRSTPYQAPIRRQVKAKPANSQSYGVTSSTARRILQSLEKMSSPLSDARRIPSSPVAFTPERGVHNDTPSKRKKVDSLAPPVQKLVTPKSISISTNMSMYMKPSLSLSTTPNTSNRRTQNIDKHKESRRSRVPDAPAPPQLESVSYPKFSTPASNGFPSGRGGGKMMREKGSHYTTKPSDEEVNVPDLPEIPLPLSMAALPKITLCPSSAATTSVTVNKSFSTAQTTGNPEFTFSSPVVKSTESNAQSPGLSVDFTFSAPVAKTLSFTSQNKLSAQSSPVKVPVKINSSTGEECGGFCKPAKTLKEGSVLDILKSPGFSSVSSQQTTTTTAKSTPPTAKPAEPFGKNQKQAFGIWYCTCCMLDNKASDNKCVACQTAKDVPVGVAKQSTSASSTPVKHATPLTIFQGFEDKFKVPPGTWDCDTCLVQNKPEATKCVACETLKPGTSSKPALLLLPTTKSDKPPVSCTNSLTTSTSIKFEELARKPIGSWECTVCLVQNKSEDSKCIACTSPKPGASNPVKTSPFQTSLSGTQGQLGLLDQFKPPAGSWDCDVCLVQNKAEAVKCVACLTAKPGTKVEPTGFGTSSLSTDPTLPSIKFGLPSSSDSSGELKSNSSTSNTAGFSFPKFSSDFKFGTTSSKPSDEEKTADFTFGSIGSTNSSGSAAFKFGFGSSTSTDVDSTVKPLKSDFSFGNVSSTVSTASKTESSGIASAPGQSARESSTMTVSFGLKEPEEKKNEPAVMGGFTFGKVDQKEPAATFVFGKKDEKTDSTATGTVFGSKGEGDQQKQLVFGKPEAAKADLSATASFAFGVTAATDKKTEQSAAPVFTFGLGALPADTGAPKPAFGFQASVPSAATQSSSIGSASSLFGNVSQPSTQTTSSVFGSAVQSITTSVSSGFGTAAAVSVAAPSSSVPAPSSTVFSSSSSLAAPSGSSNVFGSATTLNTPASSGLLFSSGGVSNTSTSSSNVFGSAAPVSTSSSSNVFGSAAPTNTSASSSKLFGNSSAPTNPSTGPFVFGQSTTTASSMFGNANEAKSTFAFSGQENKTTVTPASTAPAAATPFVFGANSASATPAPPSFNFTATNTSNVTGNNSTPFIFGSTPAAPAASVLGAANPVPSFGKTTSQTNAPAFGASQSLFPGAQPVPAFGSMTSNVQNPPVFGQQSNQPAFGSTPAPSAGSGFQFGNPNPGFNFSSGNSSGVFTFGTPSSGAQAQPPNPGFGFNQPAPTFNMGTNGRNTTTSTISNRKIKTARRRK